MSGTLRDLQSCPEWCDADNHMELSGDEPGDMPLHYGLVGEIGSATEAMWEVVITQPTDVMHTGGPVISVAGTGGEVGEGYQAKMTAPHARSLARLLIEAADRCEVIHRSPEPTS